MADDDNHTAKPRPIPHVRLYVLAGALCVASGVALVIAFAWPRVPAMPNMAAAFAVMAVLVIIGTASMKRYERYDAARREEAARILAAMGKDAAERRANIHEMFGAMGTLAYDFRRVIAFAEQGIGISHDVSEAIEGVRKRLEAAGSACDCAALPERMEGLRGELEKLVAAALVAGLRSQEGGDPASAVVPFTRRN